MDDNEANLLALDVALKERDYTLISVTSGQAALEVLERDECALILLDVRMPGLNGFSVADQIRSHSANRHTPVIFISADVTVESTTKAYEAGAVDFVAKPIDPLIIKRKVDTFVSLYRERKARIELEAERLREEAETKQRETEDRYRSLFESVDQGVCVLEMIFNASGAPVDYRFLEANPMFEKQTGLKDAVGKRVRELVPNIGEFWFQTYGRVAITGEPIRFEQAEPAMGRTFDVYAFRLGRPEQKRVALLFSDVTERRRNEERLRESEERLRFALNAGFMGTWVVDLKTSAVQLSEESQRIFGVSEGTSSVEQTVGAVVYADDQAKAKRDLEEAIAKDRPYYSEYRILRAVDKKLRWILATSHVRYDAEGCAESLSGVIIDITERKVSEEAQRQSERNFRLLFESAPGLYLVLTPDFCIVAASNAYTKATLTKRDDILGRMVFDVFPDNPDDPTANGVSNLAASLHTVLKTKASHTMAVQKYDVRRPDGKFVEKWWSPVNSPVLGPDGNVAYIIHRAEDVTAFICDRHQQGVFVAPDLANVETYMNAELFQRAHEIQDVNYRLRRALDELSAAKDEAERANALKSAFLANMSHEIRTPLGAMIGFADLLRDPELTPNQRANYVDVLTRNGESLGVIINDILDLSKVEAGHLTLEYTDTNPKQIAEEVTSLLEVKAREKNLSLHLRCDASTPPNIVADPVRVRQILLNLIGNALKFTQSGTVGVRTYGEENRVCFEVTDTGIGIPEKQRERIFEAFVQADGTTARRFGGTGLGLALSKRLAQSLGGDVRITRSAPGQGSTFLVCIRNQPELKTAGARSIRSERERRADLSGQALNGVKVLVVDDSPDNRQLIWHYLIKQGALVDTAEDGYAGVKMALNGTYNIVLMDIQMPGMDGFTAMQKLRAAGYREPIIALTAHAMSEVRNKVLHLGANAHLPKPIVPRDLISAIAEHVRPTGH